MSLWALSEEISPVTERHRSQNELCTTKFTFFETPAELRVDFYDPTRKNKFDQTQDKRPRSWWRFAGTTEDFHQPKIVSDLRVPSILGLS